MSTFFKELTSFSDFALFRKDDHYQPVPDDWWVIITDVKGSTQAVREGRYRDVNTLGAATIVAATRAALTRDFPFVFGGDGATLLVPPEYAEEVKARLLGLKALARENFALDLRVGAVLVEELTRAGKPLEVGRFALNPVLAQATIRGAGLIWAEHLIKSEPERYEAQSDRVGEPDLASLSCRWQPIPSQRGQVLALLVQAREGQEAAYDELLTAFAEIFPEGLESLNPAQATGRNAYHTTVENLRGERRYHTSAFSLSFIRRAPIGRLYVTASHRGIEFSTAHYPIPSYGRRLGAILRGGHGVAQRGHDCRNFANSTRRCAWLSTASDEETK